MVEELCNDVRKIILDRATREEDMCLIFAKPKGRILFYVSRNMRDPPHHVYLTVVTQSIREMQPITNRYLLRTQEALELRIGDILDKMSTITKFYSIYVQGIHEPPSKTYVERSFSEQHNPKTHWWPVSHDHLVTNDAEHNKELHKQWLEDYAKWKKDLVKRIMILVSTN